MTGEAAVEHAGESAARGIIAKAAASALRDAEKTFGRHAAADGLKGSAPDLLKAAEEKSVGRLSQAGKDAANTVFQRAKAAEPDITEKLTGLVGKVKGGKLAGLDFRTKSEGSLLRKVAGDVFEGKSVKEATDGINDAVRYTVESSEKDYVRVTQDTIGKMKEAGFTPVKMKNFWGKEGYQGINTVWRDASGQTFEMQFHTSESLAAKELTHDIYEMARVFPSDHPAAAELGALQNQVFGKVPLPNGAGRIGLDPG